MIVSRFAIVTEDLVFCCYQVTKFVSTRHGFAIASSAWGPCDFGPFTNLAISVSWEMSTNTVLTQILTIFVIGSEEPSWDELAWEPRCNGISSSTKFSLNIPGFQNLTSCLVRSWFPQVALIHHQPNWTLALKWCHCQFYLLVLESEFHLL